MSRKDYELLASVFRSAYVANEANKIALLVIGAFQYHLEKALKEDNARFDSAKFREACRNE